MTLPGKNNHLSGVSVPRNCNKFAVLSWHGTVVFASVTAVLDSYLVYVKQWVASTKNEFVDLKHCLTDGHQALHL